MLGIRAAGGGGGGKEGRGRRVGRSRNGRCACALRYSCKGRRERPCLACEGWPLCQLQNLLVPPLCMVICRWPWGAISDARLYTQTFPLFCPRPLPHMKKPRLLSVCLSASGHAPQLGTAPRNSRGLSLLLVPDHPPSPSFIYPLPYPTATMDLRPPLEFKVVVLGDKGKAPCY